MSIRPAVPLVLTFLLLPAMVHAARIDVPPGTSLQTAVDAAAPGDSLVLEPGTYPGAVVIDKRLRIVGQGTAFIDPLGAAVGVDITADNVTIRVREGNGLGLAIGCATAAALRVNGRDRVRVRSVQAGCFAPETAVGVDLTALTRSSFRRVISFGNNGLRVRQIGVRAGVSFSTVEGNGVGLGLLLEDIAPGGGRNTGVKIRSSLFTYNGGGTPVAVQLVNADGTVLASSSLVSDLVLDAGSDDNLVRGCTMGTVTNLGTGNCFVNNQSPTPDVCP
jgi:nitrous oxidase accessory protein NosD